MEPLNPLEKLNLLEKKIVTLVELIKAKEEQITKLTEQSANLAQEKMLLATSLENLENSLLKGSQNIEELNQERVLTKMVVDELINSIDRLFEHAQ